MLPTISFSQGHYNLVRLNSNMSCNVSPGCYILDTWFLLMSKQSIISLTFAVIQFCISAVIQLHVMGVKQLILPWRFSEYTFSPQGDTRTGAYSTTNQIADRIHHRESNTAGFNPFPYFLESPDLMTLVSGHGLGNT